MSPIKGRIRKEVKNINDEIRNKLAGYIAAAFGLVAGLAWNDAIKSFIEYYFPLTKNSILAKFIYAAAITIFVVFISFYIIKILKKEEDKENKK
jgi:polyferredoxin